MAAEGIEISHQQFLATFGQRNDAIIPAWLGEKATPEAIKRIPGSVRALTRASACRLRQCAAATPRPTFPLHASAWMPLARVQSYTRRSRQTRA
jgi:hypothetical protein